MSAQDSLTALLSVRNTSASWALSAARLLEGMDGNLGTVADPTVSYAGHPFSLPIGTPMAPADPTVGGGPILRYELAPGYHLASGIVLDPVTGILSGTPTGPAGNVVTRIIAVGMNGDAHADIAIAPTAP